MLRPAPSLGAYGKTKQIPDPKEQYSLAVTAAVALASASTAATTATTTTTCTG